ncbi:MAG: FtsX-like permease family protein [Acidimicrobiia bacterium]|nr:FtsX-like permease family protein [Acidimicrobiia bacterium]
MSSQDGGLAARRAVGRWAWRLFRREWRQEVLLITLLTVAVTAAILGASAAYTLSPVPIAAEFGATNEAFELRGLDPQLDARIAALEESFGTVDVINRRSVGVPGSPTTVELRAQDPSGVFGGPMLALLSGRYPTGAGEVAVTESVARTFGVGLDDSFTLGGAERTVVGLVENPNDLDDDFALQSAAHADPPQTVTVLVRGSPEQLDSFAARHQHGWDYSERGGLSPVLAAAMTIPITMVAMVLIGLVAAAGFHVSAQRRRRQLGMLAAVGATNQHLRLVVLTNGAAVGVVAATAGAVIGVLGWIALVPLLEEAVGARINRFDVLPWWLIGVSMLLAVIAGTTAAWWPARAVAHIPITRALSGRPSSPRPVRGSVALAGLFLTTGVGCLAAADIYLDGWAKGALIGLGAVATIIGVLFVTPLAVRVVGVVAARLPVAFRLALRDLARYQARSAAALAAISLIVGIAVTVIVTTTAAESSDVIRNLSQSQLLVTREGGRVRELVTVGSAADMEGRQGGVERIAGLLDDPPVLPLYHAVDPDQEPQPGRDGMRYAWKDVVLIGDGEQTANPGSLFVATPEILEHYGLDPDPATDIITVREGPVGLRHQIREEPVSNVERLDVPAYPSAPTSFITVDGLRRWGFEPAQAGWFIEAGSPFSSEQVAAAREEAEKAGLWVEGSDVAIDVAALRSLRLGAMAVGTLVVLVVLTMTVGLIRGEADRDLRTLAAVGATRTIRRTLTATTAGGLAVLGVLLGTAGAYVGLAAAQVTRLDTLMPVPVASLLVIAAGVPLVATGSGWLLAGRQPSPLARQVLE